VRLVHASAGLCDFGVCGASVGMLCEFVRTALSSEILLDLSPAAENVYDIIISCLRACCASHLAALSGQGPQVKSGLLRCPMFGFAYSLAQEHFQPDCRWLACGTIKLYNPK
jgi:hypothetical protein